MTQIVVGNWDVTVRVVKPADYAWYAEHALLAERFDLKTNEGILHCVTVSSTKHNAREHGKHLLVVAQDRGPEYEFGFEAGVMIVPETARLFIGVGERLLAYDLQSPTRIWEDSAHSTFWSWGRHEDYAWMAAELEFAVWMLDGTKLWSTPTSPPWTPAFSEGLVTLDDFDKKRTLRMADGTEVA